MSGERRPVERLIGSKLPPAYRAINTEVFRQLKPSFEKLMQLATEASISDSEEKEIPGILGKIGHGILMQIRTRIDGQKNLTLHSPKPLITKFERTYGHAPPDVDFSPRNTKTDKGKRKEQPPKKIEATCTANTIAQMHIFGAHGYEVKMVKFDSGSNYAHVIPIVLTRGKIYVLDDNFLIWKKAPLLDDYITIIQNARRNKGRDRRYTGLSKSILPTKNHGRPYMLGKFQKAEDIGLALGQAYFNWAYANYAIGRDNIAAVNYVKSLGHKDQPDTHSNLGIVFDRMKEYPDAERHFRIAAEMNPSPSTLNTLGIFLRERKRFEEARSVFQRITELFPKDENSREELRRLDGKNHNNHKV
jgi:hypothetical protein